MIIDIHTHINLEPGLGFNADKMVEFFTGIGVEKFCVLGWEHIRGGLNPLYKCLPTDEIFTSYKKYPNNIIPFAMVDPSRENADKILEKWIKRGAKGFGELKVRMCYDNPDCLYLFKMCEEAGLPILMHFQYPVKNRIWYGGDISVLERLAKLCPKANFIGHADGFWAEIADDDQAYKQRYPKGKIKKAGRICRLLDKCPNIYGDLSAGSGLNALKRDPDFAYKFLTRYADKLLYGTDVFDTNLKNLIESFRLPKKISDKIFYRNAIKLIKM